MGKTRAVIYALLAAVFYAVSIPVSKLLLARTGETAMAALLYLGAGVGIGILSLFGREDAKRGGKLEKSDLPYVIGMIVLDIAAPILLMLGVSRGSPAGASLLGNFEIAATAVVALAVFREKVSGMLWAAIGLITASSILLSLDGTDSMGFSTASLLVVAATVCWGFENNCTRMISSKSTYEIVILKGIFSGLGALVIALIRHDRFPGAGYILAAMALGFAAYGLSIFLYVRAQSVLGAAKTGAYYAAAPFIGAFLSFAFLREELSRTYLAALLVMIAGTVLVVLDTIKRDHRHPHTHIYTHTHDGYTHTHTVTHTHGHSHYLPEDRHGHRHSAAELEKSHGGKTAGGHG